MDKHRAWVKQLSDNGFDKVKFPVIITNDQDLSFIDTLSDYAIDPDIYYWEFENTCQMIDSNFHVWSWKYDKNIKANLPHKIEEKVSEAHITSLILNFFKNKKLFKDVVQLFEEKTSFETKVRELSRIY